MISCAIYAQNDKSTLIGTWGFDYEQSFSKMENQMQSKYNSLPDEQKIAIGNSYRNRQFMFNENGNFQAIGGSGNVITGTWEIVEDNLLHLITETGQEFWFKVKQTKNNQLVLKSNNTDLQPHLLLKELYYKKI
jgi:hypothetical protein